MYRKSKKLLVWCLVVSMVLTQMLFTNIALAATPNAGADRYETAAKVALAGWTTSNYAVLAYGEDFPDALAAAPLAAAYGAPILLTNNDKLDTYTKDALTKLGVKNVIIVGGEGVVPKAIADEVAAMTGMAAPTRVFGNDRVATALAIAKAVEAKTGVAAADVFVVNSEAYADALSISSLAAMAPISTIVLVGKDEVSADVLAYVGSKKAYVIGGTGVVSDAVMAKFTSKERVTEGTDRYGTNLAVLKTFADFKFNNVFVATGENYPDALAGSVYAAKSNAPLVLVDQAITADTMAFLKTKMAASSKVYTLGGLSTVASAASALEAAVIPTTFGVESVTVLGNTAVQVKFNKAVDKTTAQTIANYELEGVAMPAGSYAVREADEKTVTVFLPLGDARKQDSKAAFKVKNVLEKDTYLKMATYETSLSFKDVTNPTLVSAAVKNGNKTLRLTFSEPVNGNTFNGILNGVIDQNQYKINGNDLTNYGYSSINYKTVDVNGVTQNHVMTVDIKFSTQLPAGTHSVTVKKKSTSQVLDPAGLAVIEASMNFNVTADTAAPYVVESTATVGNPGEVKLVFNETLDTTLPTGFQLNGSNVTPMFKANQDPDNSVLLISGTILEGANLVVIPKDLKDAYGNKLSTTDDVRLNVNATKDTTAPTVVNVVAISDTLVRIKFSESVDNSFASTKANYKIKDAAGDTVFSESKGTWTVTHPAANNDRAFVDLGLTALAGGTYTIEIKNIRDGAGNAMVDYTGTFTSPDKTAPTLATSGNKAYRDGQTIELFFSEAMDSASLVDKANYRYKLGGVWKEIPSSATIEAGSSNKSVKITFPDTVIAGNITDMRALNVKDVAGNVLKDGQEDALAISTTRSVNPLVVADTINVYGDDDKVWLTFETDKQLSAILRTDFVEGFLTGVTGEVADIAEINGKTVKLTYNSPANEVAAIKAAGSNLTIGNGITLAATTKNSYGDPLATPATGTLKVKDNIAPILASGTKAAITGAKQITVYFNETLDQATNTTLKTAFVIEASGQVLTIDDAVVGGSNVVLTTKENVGATAKVKVNAGITLKDKNGNAYAPKQADKDGYTIAPVAGATTSLGVAVNAPAVTTPGAAPSGGTFETVSFSVTGGVLGQNEVQTATVAGFPAAGTSQVAGVGVATTGLAAADYIVSGTFTDAAAAPHAFMAAVPKASNTAATLALLKQALDAKIAADALTGYTTSVTATQLLVTRTAKAADVVAMDITLATGEATCTVTANSGDVPGAAIAAGQLVVNVDTDDAAGYEIMIPVNVSGVTDTSANLVAEKVVAAMNANVQFAALYTAAAPGAGVVRVTAKDRVDHAITNLFQIADAGNVSGGTVNGTEATKGGIVAVPQVTVDVDTITLAAADDTAAEVAAKIRAAALTNWTTSGTGADVVLTAKTVGNQGAITAADKGGANASLVTFSALTPVDGTAASLTGTQEVIDAKVASGATLAGNLVVKFNADVNVQVTAAVLAGDNVGAVADSIVAALNANGTFSASWTASKNVVGPDTFVRLTAKTGRANVAAPTFMVTD